MVSPYDSTAKFDAFEQEHEDIERTLAELREILLVRQDDLMVIVTLGSLCNDLKSHFVHEVQKDGFFDNVIEQAPWLKNRADALIREHAQFGDALEELLSRASQGTPNASWWNDLNNRFEAFWKLFCRHERAEIDLVQEAFNDDIGAAD
jgi:hypothetical protein